MMNIFLSKLDVSKFNKTLISLAVFFILLFHPQFVAAAIGDILFFDNFEDGNLTDWTIQSGIWTIDNGNLISNQSGTAIGSRINRGLGEWDDYRVELDINNQEGIDVGIGFRRDEINNSAYELVLRFGNGEYDTPQIVLNRAQDGLVTTKADTRTVPLNRNQWYTVKIEAIETNIKIWINNMLVFDINDSSTNVKKGYVSLSSWTGDIGIVTVRFDNIKVTSLSSNIFPPPEPPLILIPGIGGSELKIAEDTFWNQDDGHGGKFNYIYPKDEKVWVNEGKATELGDDDYFDVLRMKKDGINSEANLDLTGDIYERAYQETINFFTSNGYTLNKDLFIFPYDWRRDITLTAKLLDAKISQIKSQAGAAQVSIIAHSMGGLVARNYIMDPTKAQNVRKLFTLGTPHLGSVKFLKALRFGDCLFLEIGPICPILAPTEANDVLQNMISGFQLAPSQTYFNFYSNEDNLHPYPYKTEAGPLNYNQIKDLLTIFGHNTALFAPSETFHSIDSDLVNTNGVEVTIIAGSGQPTIGQIIEEKTISLLGIEGIKKDIRIINGDETVPLFSASLNDPIKNRSYLGSAKVYYTNQKHPVLIKNGPALNLVNNILKGSDELPEGVSNQPYPLPLMWSLSAHSPVNIHVYDPNGNHTGPTNEGNFEANIPGSSYDTLDDAKFIFLPENGVYNIKFEATDQGSFDFKIREFKNDINNQTILYQKIPLTAATKAEAVFDTTASTPPLLQVDSDGNGEVDSQVNPTATLSGNAASDQTPPKTIVNLSGIAGDNGWFKDNVTVELIGQDEASGSGVAKTEFSLANTSRIHTYTKPFTISREGISKLKVKSTDFAGNEELPQEIEIKIDKTAPELEITPDFRNRRFKITGVDNLSTTQTQASTSGELTVTDQAGNITRLKTEQNEGLLSLKSIAYQDLLPVSFPDNQFTIIFTGTHQQKIIIADKTEVTANYNREGNKTYIETKKPDGTLISETRNGFALLQLLTNKGQLEVKY